MTKVEMTKVEYNGKQLDIPKYLLQTIEIAYQSGRDLWYDVAKYTMGELYRERRLDLMDETIKEEIHDKTPERYLDANLTEQKDIKWYRIAINSARNLSRKYQAYLITDLINEDAEFEPNDEDFRYFLGAINIKRTLYNLFKKNWDAVYLRPINRGD